ncbi:MAG: EAL domain-containing protein [Oscillospiraceae bacterium]|nr:EAL domain-containing protein [Oscillospiraceae bacterium]
MSAKTIDYLNQYIEKALTANNRSELNDINREYALKFSSESETEETEKLKINIFSVMSLLVESREESARSAVKKHGLSEQEKAEISKVHRILDKNLLMYYFQPIVRTDNGEIYSYEALMRAVGIKDITPYHILKYAEISDRLFEVEQYSFINVMEYMLKNEELFGSRSVFINSLPNVHVKPEKELRIEELLDELRGRVVVEMTENSEFNDSELNDIKQKYKNLDVPIAIDDYGTGYSNISNLLRYTPDYVKIDRSLLSGIQNSPNKKHFVREIIDFCHDNGIMALAEGVETAEELRTVILLGADLVQGFYIAMPSPEVIPAVQGSIKNEICAHRQELEDGKRQKVYYAEKGERVPLDRLNREGYSGIMVGRDYTDGTVTVYGLPHYETDIHLETSDGFKGTVVLDSARLSNQPDRPCIGLGENSDVTITLKGVNKLSNSGIRVPESSVLKIEGKGSVDIKLGNSENYYGIGNDMGSAHGDLIFDQDGTISVAANSHMGVCIGSGLGGNIYIRRGRYVLSATGSMSVCLGAFSGDTHIEMKGCDFEGVSTGAHCAVAGSINGDADIYAIYSSIKCRSDSQLSVCLGTVTGSHAKIHIESVSVSTEMSADCLTSFGALSGASDIVIERSSVRSAADGARSLVFGGTAGNSRLGLTDVDLFVEIATEMRKCIVANDDDINIVGGRYRIKVNGAETSILN